MATVRSRLEDRGRYGFRGNSGGLGSPALKGLSQHLILKGMVLMGGCRLDPGLAEVVRGHLAAGMRPGRVARVTGVPASTVYRLDLAVSGVPRRVRQREAARRREDARLERAGQAAQRRLLLAGRLAGGMQPDQAAKGAGGG